MKKEVYLVKIGPGMKKILDKQIENIKMVTYDIVNSTSWDASEILAKKINEAELI